MRVILAMKWRGRCHLLCVVEQPHFWCIDRSIPSLRAGYGLRAVPPISTVSAVFTVSNLRGFP